MALGTGILAALLGGCASYRPLPLPVQADSPNRLAGLHGYAATDTPLDIVAVERLVLLNNPDLRSARAQHAVAQAQMLQAGLLPNPSVNANVGYLLSGAGDATAWAADISQDVMALVTLRPRREAARSAAAQVDAGLLWQEWQTVGKARLLVVDLVQGARLCRLLQQALDLLEQRSTHVRQSVQDGNQDLVAAAPDLSATAEARVTLDELRRRLLTQRHELAALLGLAADATVPLRATVDLPAPEIEQIRQNADSLGRRRPDLVALQLGYQAQEANLRAAVLAQFPALSIGYNASQDNSRVRNGGPSISFQLPIFDRNQGNIAIARATRQQLHDEYAARLNSAHNEIVALLAERTQLLAQQASLAPQAAESERIATQARHAWQAGLIDLRNYVDLSVAALTRQSEAIALEQALLEQQVALDTLVGAGMPPTLTQDVITP